MVTKSNKAKVAKRIGRAVISTTFVAVLAAAFVGAGSLKISSFSEPGLKVLSKKTLMGFNIIYGYAYKKAFENKENLQFWKLYESVGIKLRKENKREEIKIMDVYIHLA